MVTVVDIDETTLEVLEELDTSDVGRVNDVVALVEVMLVVEELAFWEVDSEDGSNELLNVLIEADND